MPPGVSPTSPQNLYTGQAFAFNTTSAPAYNNPIRTGIVGMQGITNYGVGRASTNGIGGFVFSAGPIRSTSSFAPEDSGAHRQPEPADHHGARQPGRDDDGRRPVPIHERRAVYLAWNFQPTISQQQIGTTLTVTPRISPDGRVLMRVEPSIVAPRIRWSALAMVCSRRHSINKR